MEETHGPTDSAAYHHPIGDVLIAAGYSTTLNDAPIPGYMQGTSMRPLHEDTAGGDWQDVAYHRYWMHKDFIHNAFAHYGVRDSRYKLIYWYNDPLDQLGASPGEEPPEWELFDCQEDPFELHNRACDPACSEVFVRMLAKLDAKMAEIGDLPEHDSPVVLDGMS